MEWDSPMQLYDMDTHLASADTVEHNTVPKLRDMYYEDKCIVIHDG